MWRYWLKKKNACQCRTLKRCGFDPWVETPAGGNGNSLQYSCLENPMDRGASGGRMAGRGGAGRWGGGGGTGGSHSQTQLCDLAHITMGN